MTPDNERLLVVDASVALTWCFHDEVTTFTRVALHSAQTGVIVVPAVWWFELANAMVNSKRKGRLTPDNWQLFRVLIASISVITDRSDDGEIFRDVATLSQTYSLTVYDASYLELAMRRGARLATLDKALIAAANQAGVALFDGGEGV